MAAQQNVRISTPIDEVHLTTLQGNTHPLARVQYDRGLVSPELPMGDLVLVLNRGLVRQAAFDKFVASQYDPTSPNYHHWLQPEQVGEEFGPAESDVVAISNWLSGHGLSIDEVSKDRMSIRFSGTAAQVENTFHAGIHNLNVKSEMHIGNMTDPQIPSALVPVVAGVKALHNFFPRPLHQLGSTVMFDRETGKWERGMSVQAASPKVGVAIKRDSAYPLFASSDSGSDLIEDVTPYDFAAIYNVLPLWTARVPIDGTGQTIAIAGTSNINLTDIAAFRNAFGLPAMVPTILITNTDPGACSNAASNCIADLIENSADVEWAGAVAKGAQIVLVTSSATTSTTDSLYLSENYIVQNKTAPVMSVSYGVCELGLGSAGNAAYNELWQMAAAEGIAVFVAAGDADSAECDDGLNSSVPYAAQYGLSVSGLASTPYDTAVGGTDLDWSDKASRYWSTSNNSTTLASAKGYMPEVPWNDTCASPRAVSYLKSWANYIGIPGVVDAETACNFALDYYLYIYETTGGQYDLSGLVDVMGAGGGMSACTTSNGTTVASCTGGYAKPAWQAGVPGIPTDGRRDIPDVSFFASNGFLGSAYLICVSADGSCAYSTTSELTAQEMGGTSIAAPVMASIMALINQKAGATQGSPNAELYSLAAKQTYSGCSTESATNSSTCFFNDIDTGSNAVPCQPVTSDCTTLNSKDAVGILTGYSASLGYDPVTGLGSLNVANAVSAWPVPPVLLSAAVTVTPAQTTLSGNTALNVTAKVTGTGATPTGTVTLSGGGYNSSAEVLSGGSYTFVLPANSLSAGTDTLTVTYSGDSTYTSATGTAAVTVLLIPAVTVTPAMASLSTSATLSVTAKVTGTSTSPTGTVTLSGGGYSSPAETLSDGSYTFILPANSLSVGTDPLTVSYSGDSNYSSATGTASVIVAKSTFTLAATSPSAIAPGSSATSTITVTGVGGYVGTVMLTCSLTIAPSGATNLPTCSTGSSEVTLNSSATTGTATVTLRTTAPTIAQARLRHGQNRGWVGTGGGAFLAFLFCLGIPVRRYDWQSGLSILAAVMLLSNMTACTNSMVTGTGNKAEAGSTAGTYTFTVTGSGSPVVSPMPYTTFTLTLN
jgi:subtilase family serine protease